MNFYLAISGDFLNFRRSYELWHLRRNTIHEKQSQAGRGLTSVCEREGKRKRCVWK